VEDQSTIAGTQLQRATGEFAPVIDRFARFGFAVKGVVTILIGALALRYALGSGVTVEGPQGAIEELRAEPFGELILGVLAAGLAAYALWMFVEAIIDPERKGAGLQGVAERGAFFVTGIGYALLARATLALLFANDLSSDMGLEDLAASVLTPVLGRWVVGLAGSIVMVAGLLQLRLGLSAGFRHILRPALPKLWQVAILLTGAFGYVTLGFLSLTVGYSLLQVAIRYNPSEAGGWDESLWLLAGLVEGRWLLGIGSAGLICYGLYSVLLMRYRTL